MWRCQRAEQCGLTGPERAGGDSDEEVQHERVPGLANQREERKGDRGDHEGAAEHDTRPEPVGERAADEARGKCSQGTGRNDKAGNAEREPADVVQVDDQKRPDDAVPEHVREAARLKDPDVPRKLRIQAPKVGTHGCAGYRRGRCREGRPCRRSLTQCRSSSGVEPNEIMMAPRGGAGFRSGVRLAGIEPATLRSGGARSIP